MNPNLAYNFKFKVSQDTSSSEVQTIQQLFHRSSKMNWELVPGGSATHGSDWNGFKRTAANGTGALRFSSFLTGIFSCLATALAALFESE
jgi:hypothetical protein